MYIEFRLPQGSGGQAAAYANYLIDKELRAWSDQYRIPYRSKIIKYVKRVTFDNDASYSFFAMTWNPTSPDFIIENIDYRLVEPMNTRDK
jgi:uncharacterized protein YijF (DUF1287 family)